MYFWRCWVGAGGRRSWQDGGAGHEVVPSKCMLESVGLHLGTS